MKFYALTTKRIAEIVDTQEKETNFRTTRIGMDVSNILKID